MRPVTGADGERAGMYDRSADMRTKEDEVRKTAATITYAGLRSQMIFIAIQYEVHADRWETLAGFFPPSAAGGDRQPH